MGSWTLGGTAGSNTLTATSAGLAGSPATFTATGTTGAASTITLFAGNGQTAVAGSAVATAPAVKVTDLGGNPVSNVPVTFAVTGGGGSVQPVSSVLTDGGGIAAASSWTLGTTAGSNTLTATASGLAGSPVAFTATGIAGTATQLVVTTQPSTTAQNTAAFATQPVVQLRDANNNNVSQVNVGVTATIASGGGSLGGTALVNTNSSGQAVFAGLSITGTVGARTLSFSSLGLAPATSGAVTITAGPATTLAINAGNNQSAPVGTVVAIPPSVLVTDVSGNPVNLVAVTFTVTSGGGSLTGGSATSNTSGIATVGSWTLGVVAGSNTLSAASGTLSGSPASFTATGTTGAATKLVVTTAAPTSVQNDIAFTTQPVVQLQDASSNPVAQSGVTVTAALFSTTRTLTNGSAVTDGAGKATFSGLAITGLIGTDSLNFTATGLTATPRTLLTVTAGTAVKLGMNRQASTTGQSGVVLAIQPRTQVQDVSGNSVSVNGVLVTATIASGPSGATLTNPTATSVSTGLATFADLTISGPPGTYTLQFDATAAGYTAVVSGNIVLSVGPASQLTITTQPLASVASGAAFSPPPVLQLRDGFGNAVPSAGIAVTAAVASGPGGSTLTNAVATTDGAGAATFAGLTLSGTAGNYTLSFSGTNLTPITSNTVALSAGGGSKLGVTTQPAASAVNGAVFAPQPVIQLQDGSGNPVNTAGVSVTASIASGGGSLGGTTVVTTNGSGQAVFTNLTITGLVGNRTLLFAASGYTGVTSNTVSLTAGPATQIAVSAGNGQSATVGTAVATAPAVIVRDASTNVVSGVSVTFAVTGGGGSVTGGSATTDAFGIATVGSWTLGNTAGSNTLTATSTGLSGSPVGFAATGTASAPTQITINAGNSQSATVNTAVATAPSVLVRDVHNNPVNGVVVSWLVTGGGGALSVGTGGSTNASGIATVTSWTLGTTAGVSNNTMTATAAGVGTPATFTATATAGAPATVTINAGNGQSATVNTAVATAPSVIVRDGFSNPVNGATVTWLVTGGGGTVSVGTGGSTNASGIATVTSWTLGATAGVSNNTMTATAAGVGTPATFTATATAGAPATVAINAGNGQSATVNTDVTTAPSVIVRDASNNPVSGVAITWLVTGGGGTVSVGTGNSTNASGIATVTSWTVGTAAGVNTNTMTATAAGVGTPATFTATATAGAATSVAVSAGNSQSAAIGTAVAIAPSVLVTDGFGNPVDAHSVTFAVTGGGGSLTGATTSSNTSGIATVGSWTLGTTVGGNTLSATASGVGTPASFSASATAGATTTLITSTSPDPSVSGQSVTVSVTVSGAGTPTGTVSVTDGASVAACTVTLSGGSGNCAMALAAAGGRTISAVYNGDANHSGSSSSDPHTVNKAATTASITAHTPDPATVGTAYTVDWSVAVTAPGGGTLSGNVTVSDGTGASCFGAVGAGTCQLTSTSTGTKTLTASYAGDANFLASVSTGVTHQVDPIATTTTITSVNPASIVLGQPTTVSFTVSGGATGNVTVGDGTVSCVVTVATGSCSLTPTSAGAKVITATYAGDATHAGSSDTDALTVAAFGAPNAGQTTAQVPATGQVAVVTSSTVQLRDNLGNLITSSGGNIIAASITSGPNTGAIFTVADNANGTYTLDYVPVFGSGTDSIQITLSGTPIGGSPYSSTIP